MTGTILTLKPWTRVNDKFVRDACIDASPITTSTKNPLVQGIPNCQATRFQAEFYKHIACDVVVETVFDYPHPYISEKTLRPIACKRIFIVAGAAGILDVLHKKGFETFDDIIDENYDSLRDPTERFLAVVEQVKKICATPLEDLKNYMRLNSKKFDKNFQTLKNLESQELQNIAKQFNIDI